jgi:hypothetical protein
MALADLFTGKTNAEIGAPRFVTMLVARFKADKAVAQRTPAKAADPREANYLADIGMEFGG